MLHLSVLNGHRYTDGSVVVSWWWADIYEIMAWIVFSLWPSKSSIFSSESTKSLITSTMSTLYMYMSSHSAPIPTYNIIDIISKNHRTYYWAGYLSCVLVLCDLKWRSYRVERNIITLGKVCRQTSSLCNIICHFQWIFLSSLHMGIPMVHNIDSETFMSSKPGMYIMVGHDYGRDHIL